MVTSNTSRSSRLRVAAAVTFFASCLPYTVSSQDAANFPKDFKLADALSFYHIESASLFKRSLLAAGFDVDETIEINEIYLDFATRALSAEAKRIERIREALQEKQALHESQTCNSDSATGECANGNEEKAVDEKLSSEFGHFLTHDLSPGQAELLHWEDDGSIVQEYGARVGLPPNLVPTLKSYAEEMGLWEIMNNMLYDDPLAPGGSRFFTFSSPYQKGLDSSEIRNFTWNVERPEKKWKSDMHWFNTANELAHEDSLRALAKGGFDQVLAGIGEKFGLDHLHVDSLGFVAVTNCDRGFIHTDWEDVDGKAFNFLVGIASPEDAGPELVVEGDKKGELYYGTNAGVLVGDGTRHGTRECDHRAKRGVRITCSIYLADLNKNNLPVVAGDTTSMFPPEGEVNWIWSQRGRHWHKDGGRSLETDLGRTPFAVEDALDECDKKVLDGKCIGDTEERAGCLKTCGVFVDDAVYKPGEERRKVFGY